MLHVRLNVVLISNPSPGAVQERELVATLYSELHSMTTQNGKLKRRVVLRGGSGAPALATAAPCPQASTCEAGMAAFVSPFGGFSPFTPGRNSP